MYFKVALFLILTLILSGCNSLFSPKPKVPSENNVTHVEQNATIIPETEDKIIEKKVKRDKYNLKPEPFSLESNENDPELLGPQTTLNRDLLKKENDIKKKSDNTQKNGKNTSKTLSKTEEKNIKNDNKQEEQNIPVSS